MLALEPTRGSADDVGRGPGPQFDPSPLFGSALRSSTPMELPWTVMPSRTGMPIELPERVPVARAGPPMTSPGPP
jgi:hypothetical protein